MESDFPLVWKLYDIKSCSISNWAFSGVKLPWNKLKLILMYLFLLLEV